MSSKALPTVAAAGAKIGAEVIGEGIEAGGRIAAAAISGIGAAVGGAAQGIGSALGGALQGALTEGPKTIITNVGIAGEAGKQKTSSGGGNLPAPKRAAKPAYNEKMPTEKLLAVAVGYLASIDSTLRTQIENDRLAAQKQAQAEKEAAIEDKGGDGVFKKLGDKLGAGLDATKNKASEMAGTLLKGGLLLGGIGAIGLSKLDTSELTALKANVEAFKRDFGWLIDLAQIAGGAASAAWFGKLVGMTPVGRIVLAIGGALVGLGYIQDRKREEFKTGAVKMFSEDARERAEKYFQKRSMLMNQRGGDPTKKGIVESVRAFLQGSAGTAEDIEFLKKDLKKQGYSNTQIDVILFGTQDEIKDATVQGGSAPTADTFKPAPPADVAEDLSNTPDTAYDIVLGYGRYGKPEQYYGGRKLTQLTVAEVIEFGRSVLQPRSRADGVGRSTSGQLLGDSGVGAYATNRTTIQGAIDAGVISPNELYNKEAQDRVAKWLYDMRNRQGNLHNTWAYFGTNNQRSSTMTFEQAKPYIMAGEGTSGQRVNNMPLAPDGGNTNTASFSVESAMSMAKTLFKKGGGALIGAENYKPRDYNEKAGKIGELSKQLEAVTIAGTEQKVEPPGQIAATAAQKSIMQASSDGSLTAIDPNYPGKKEDTIMTYLAHWKFTT